MKSLIWSAIALFVTHVTASVVTLNNAAEFNTAIEDNRLVLIKFFAPWCDHCKALKPEYEQSATLLEAEGMMVAEVDCTSNSDICEKYKIQGYPTLQIFRKGQPSDIYSGERKADSIVNYMKKHLMPSLVELNTKEAMDTLKEQEPLVAIAFLSQADEQNTKTWKAISDKFGDDFAFGVVTDSDFIKSEGISSLPTVVLYKRFDPLSPDYYRTNQLDIDQVEDFIKLNSVPLLAKIEPDSFMDYVDAGRPIAYIFSDSEDMEQDMHTAFLPLAQSYKGKLSFVHIDANKYSSQADFLSLAKDQWPALAIHDFKTGARYPYRQSLRDKEAIQLFLESVVQGQAQPAIKSQAFPVRNSNDPVKVVTGNDFEEIVHDRTKDVLLEIYAPWCAHSQALAPTYEQLGELMKTYDAENSHGIVIAKMDGTVNDVPPSAGFQVTGYPTIKLFKANTNQMVDYDGDRTLDSFVDFLSTHSTQQTFKMDKTKRDEL
ncbi:thioredoxin-like protein [Gilbertella persicaria]|uniref:thioredoxin-like protein n=1 Tax=Gilbertella persicaria TaxID=101096 RepID=UPI00222038DE|nr:thioredoxin-like protein [Gilbertella persicaria]KAI8088079.1 thioredoxin-like protein [Gilbertella persicaria]